MELKEIEDSEAQKYLAMNCVEGISIPQTQSIHACLEANRESRFNEPAYLPTHAQPYIGFHNLVFLVDTGDKKVMFMW